MSAIDTIFALSSGALPSGVAVVRVSGPDVRGILASVVGAVPEMRVATLRDIGDPFAELVIDRGLVLWFEGPNSFTGEDCAEFHLHGGRAVVSSFLNLLGKFDNCRIADAGEFSKRAFENGKFDLTEIEGLSDLLAAETEQQRVQAINQSSGKFREKLDVWRSIIVKARALIEAELDFSEEEDVPGSVSELVWSSIQSLESEINTFLRDNKKGEIIRDGFRVVLMGAPNAGKSSLLNALADRDVAIVSDEAGTTRDMLEVHLNIDGYNVIITDTAGIRVTESAVELEGIRRAHVAGSDANLVYWLSPANDNLDRPNSTDVGDSDIVVIRTKSDIASRGNGDLESVGELFCNTVNSGGIDSVLNHLTNFIKTSLYSPEVNLITRERHRLELSQCSIHLKNSLDEQMHDIVFRAEELRLASDHLGKVTGRVDVEDLLDVIFSEFCVGK